MADKTPVRVVYNSSDVATGLAEYQSGETIGYAFGGTGLSSLGSAGQVLRVNAAGNGLEFGADGDLSVTNLVAPTNADLTFSTSGTGDIVVGAVRVRGTTLSSDDSSQITFAEGADITGALTASTSLTIAGDGATVTGIKDEDAMGSNSATKLATQQSIKAYADTKAGLTGSTNNTVTTVTGANAIQGESNLTFDGSTLGVTGAITATTSITAASFVTSGSTGVTYSDNGISTSSSNADINITPHGTGDVVISALRVNGATLDSSDSATVTVGEALDVTGALTASTSLNIADDGATVTGIKDEDNMASDSATKLATQQSIKAYVDGEVSGLSQTSISQNNSNVTVVDSGTGNVTIEVDGTDRITTVAATTTTATGHSLVIGAGSNSAGGSIKFLEGTDNGTNGVTLLGPASTADVTVTLPAAADTLVGKATTDTLTNKTLTSPVLNTGVSGTAVLDEDAMGSDSATQLATQQSIKAYADTKAVLTGSTNNTITTVTGSNAFQGESNLTFDGATLAVTGAVTISGDLTISGDTTTVATTNTTLEDNLLELNTGISQSLNDSGIIIERGSTGDNAGIIWDESADKFVLGTTTATAADKSGGITITPGTLEVASLTADSVTITDNTISTNASNSNLQLSGNSSGFVCIMDGLCVAEDGATVTGIKDEDGMDSNSATKLATQQSIKAYVDAQVTAQDLDFQGDSGGALAIDLDSETLDIAGGTGIDTSGSSNTLTVAIDSTVTTLTGSQTLTNKTLTAPTITATSTTVGGKIKFLEGTDNGTNGVTLVGAASTADVDLILPAAADTLVGKATTDTLTNKTLTSPVLNTGVSGTAILDEDAMGSDSATQLATQQSIKAYADTKAVLTGSTNNTITTVTGAHAFQGEANLTFDGTDMLVASSGKIKFTDANESIHSDGTNLTLTSGGTSFKWPTADGSNGQSLVTNGGGTLSFATVTTTVSDDSLATARSSPTRSNKNLSSSIRTLDSFNVTYADSALYFGVMNDLVNEKVSAEMFSIVNNDSAAFIGGSRGVETAGGENFPTLTVDVSNTMVRLRAVGPSAECKMSFYKIPLSTANTADATSGNTVVTSNTDVDSASESIDSWAHATYRAAKYFISIDNDSKTEVSAVEALVVHNGSDAFISTYGVVNSGSNDLLSLTAAISGSNVVISAAGLETNLNLTIHKILLTDSMTAAENANQKVIGAVTISSAATAIDTMDLDEANGAVYYVVSKNATEGTYGLTEVFAAATPGLAAVASSGSVSTKGTAQLEFTAAFDTASENAYELFASSTSGGSTVVNAYRINCLAG